MLSRFRPLLDPSRWIVILLAFGGAALVYIVIAASQSTEADTSRLAARAPAETGFDATFPPRIVPDYPLSTPQGDRTLRSLGQGLAIVQFSPSRCESTCANAAISLAQASLPDHIHRAHVRLKGSAADVPSEIPVWEDKIGSFDTYVPASARAPITIVIDVEKRIEIGRLTGSVDWQSPTLLALMDRLGKEALRP